MDLIIHFSIALLVSFVGYLPFGTVNMAVIDSSLRTGAKAAIQISVGAAFIEIFHSLIAIHFNTFIIRHIQENAYVKLFAVLILLVLGIYFIMKKPPNAMSHKSNPLASQAVGKGALLATFNPHALPFWVFILSYFNSKNWVQLDNNHTIISFLMGVSMGRFLSLLVYLYLGLFIANKMQSFSKWMNLVIGSILLFIAVLEGISLAV
ncbi:MAG: LysE family translocator [Candidatus Cyclobacteriaceae bacterium M3_2C_046]